MSRAEKAVTQVTELTSQDVGGYRLMMDELFALDSLGEGEKFLLAANCFKLGFIKGQKAERRRRKGKSI